ncbi:beta-1,4-N-acetylglucosaminyltransferase [Nematocida sp. LUAm3]|nr:beta-1,4-N-acetylglucosaminyltransferase [Nematocida sp. LUAm3]KAI5173930.1 beta-1,4-N-acetylglucosaminyltransferase [Nematocida sp. LUAm2]KAI5177325.1 beta-1,4-N-acetylglucosaminyltransferase [Nematocida sp. LUAm1]
MKDGSLSGSVVLGGGGHTAEMMEILKECPWGFDHLNVIVSSGDINSRRAIKELKRVKSIRIIEVPRPNEVLQGYSFFKIVYSLFACFYVVYGISGKFLLCNGPGVCVPICISHRILHPRTKIWYVESFTRVKTLSLTGKIIQWFSNLFIVQSPHLSNNSLPKRIYQPFFIFETPAQ